MDAACDEYHCSYVQKNNNKHLYSTQSSKLFSGALRDKQYIQEHKSHLVKGRFKQMCLKTFLKVPIDLHSVIDTGRAFHSLGAAILKVRSAKRLSRLRGTVNR